LEALVAQLYLTFYDPTDCSPPGSSVLGIFQARTLEWVAISFSRVLGKLLAKMKAVRHQIKYSILFII